MLRYLLNKIRKLPLRKLKGQSSQSSSSAENTTDTTSPKPLYKSQRKKSAKTAPKPKETPNTEPERVPRSGGKKRRASAEKTEQTVRPESTPWTPEVFQVDPQEGRVRFHDLNLPEELMHAIYDLGFAYCTPIQEQVLPRAIEGKDAIGKAQTGTGKSAAFLMTIICRLLSRPQEKASIGRPRALILAPTRELAMQISKDAHDLCRYTPLKIVTLFGGMDMNKQRQRLENEAVDIVVATPGRLLDLKYQKCVFLGKVEILVIDEADRMLDMGFIPDVRQIVNSTMPKHLRQTLLFSATLSNEVTRLASAWMTEPFMVEIEPEQVTVETVDQLVYITTREEKFTLLWNTINQANLTRVIVFANRRDETRHLSEKLTRYGVTNAILSGEVPQAKRIRTLENFREGKIAVLVATDVAGRGIHVDSISHVINYNLPENPEDYVHRIGRTGRAGASGISVSFACENDSFYIPAIEDYIGKKLTCKYPGDELLRPLPAPQKKEAAPQEASSGSKRSSRSRNRRKPRKSE